MKAIGFISIKGGCGKSSLAILTARHLVGQGKKVLFIDADVQNSASFYFIPTGDEPERRNIARAMMEGDLMGNIIPIAEYPNLDLIPSHFNLLKLRGISVRTLSVAMAQVKNDYDYVIVDSAPTLDNIVLNVARAVDVIITPCAPATFDWKTTKFLKDQLVSEIDDEVLNKWHVLRNMWKLARTDSPDALATRYDDLLGDTFGRHLMDTKILDTAFVTQAIDFRAPVTPKGKSAKLHQGLVKLIEETIGSEALHG